MYVIWICEDELIASFHEEEGYEKCELPTHELFQLFVLDLVNKRYRFQ